MIYYELWIMLWKWKKEFSVKEFISTFQTPSPNKILFDMNKKGFIEKAERGNYKVISPEQLFENRINISKAYDLVRKTGLKYSFTGPDAVFLWTKGGYQVGRFFGFYPIYLKILRSDLKKWKGALKSENMKFYIKGELLKETYIGAFYILMPEEDFKTEIIDNFSVDSLKETIKFCKDNIYQYEPALEMLNEMYSLDMEARYREA
ncbi:MAG: hypothetical protein KJ697_04930 [Nanoarchaeota archaeon]|nr:hypothetical protein [Nanoarchaeota archaeon]MBU4124066.1 hypothetical protein [Nanoarchaeota archaeon]